MVYIIGMYLKGCFSCNIEIVKIIYKRNNDTDILLY